MFDGKNYRTTKMDILARHIFQIKSDLDKNKKRKSEQISCFSCFVPSTEEISKHLVPDLERILKINKSAV